MGFSTILRQKQPVPVSNHDAILMRTLSATSPENARPHAEYKVLVPVPE